MIYTRFQNETLQNNQRSGGVDKVLFSLCKKFNPLHVYGLFYLLETRKLLKGARNIKWASLEFISVITFMFIDLPHFNVNLIDN